MPGGEEVSTERVCNLITLDQLVHSYWDRGLVAFRSISVNKEETEMQIAFHWLPFQSTIMARNDRLSASEIRHLDLKTPPSRTYGENNYLFHMETMELVTSGYVFTVKTDDKENRPLPSKELLELRWHLSRIAAMQEGAGEDDDSDDDSEGGSFSVPSGSRSPKKVQALPLRGNPSSFVEENEL
ncbi:unnamed protein product [Penicillium salamii]|nr:unnamed protein product [Penicillium salamii]